MSTYVFPGQGSQKRGMGGELFDAYPDYVEKADAILEYSLKDLCLNDPENVLGRTQYTQPAIYALNCLSYLKKIEKDGKTPDYVAGHSLGEFSALFAANVFDFETGLKLVRKRGALMAAAGNGGMAAVMGLPETVVKETLARHRLEVDIANYNSPDQLVLSGPKKEIEKAKTVLEKARANMVAVLNVSGAFHSRHMRKAANAFDAFLKEQTINSPEIPVISNYTARPHAHPSIKAHLVGQLTNPVKWTETIRYLMGKGETEFVEVGPGNVLTRLVKQIQKACEPLIVSEEGDEGENQTGEEPRLGKEPLPQDPGPIEITASNLGSSRFKQDYNLTYSYLGGGMYKGVSSKEMVIRFARAGMMCFLGTGGRALHEIERDVLDIQETLTRGETFGVNVLNTIDQPELEEKMVDMLLQREVRVIEASAYIQVSSPLIRYRAQGLEQDETGKPVIRNRIIAKISRPEVAQAFMSPAPERLLQELLKKNAITALQADISRKIPMADDICVEADSGGHTDMGVAYTLMPSIQTLRDEQMKIHGYDRRIHVGAAGGIGTPEAAAAAFVLGADFILTGSINQCTVEGRIADVVKDMLQDINVQDTDYAPAGDMFELGARVQVLKRGVFFPARANKLYELYKNHQSLEALDAKTRDQLEKRYFQKTIEEVWRETRDYWSKENPGEIEKAEKSSKHKMALIFRWYFGLSSRLAFAGDVSRNVDFQVHTGPALGAFNQWVKGTELEKWRARHVDEIALKLLHATAELLKRRYAVFGHS